MATTGVFLTPMSLVKNTSAKPLKAIVKPIKRSDIRLQRREVEPFAGKLGLLEALLERHLLGVDRFDEGLRLL